MKVNRPRVLINVPRGSHGGVANYYAGLKNKFRDHVAYYYVGGRRGSLALAWYMLVDIFGFVSRLLRDRLDIVHVNPSLDTASTIREGIFLSLAKLFRKKVIVFWRGWDKAVEEKISARHAGFFRLVFGKADAMIVLAREFAAALEKWGIEAPIHLETTQVDDDMLDGFDIEGKNYSGRSILFMARIEKNKGVYETIDAVQILDLPEIELVVAGSGPELDRVKDYVSSRGIDNVTFPGYVTGKDKIAALRNADIFAFPTNYGEGMPNCVLEAMAFGLPVVTRPVGGLTDFFENGKMGFMTESMDPNQLAALMGRILADPGEMKTMGRFNHDYAKERFWASRVARRLEDLYEEVFRSAGNGNS